MIELTEQQRQALREAGWPPRAIDPRTRETFVLLHEEMYQRVRALLEREDEIASVEEMYPLLSEALDADPAFGERSA